MESTNSVFIINPYTFYVTMFYMFYLYICYALTLKF